MTRIAPSSMPGLEGDRLDRGDRADRTPAGGPGAPFRAALRKADKLARTVEDPPPPPAPLAQPPPHAHSGSIADVIASSTDGASDAPGIRAAHAPGATATAQDASAQDATSRDATAQDATAQDATAQDATAQGTAGQRKPANVSDSPVTAWVAAAVARAVGSFASAGATAGAKAGASTANGADAANAGDATSGDAAVPPTPLTVAGLDAALPALSPLEQAVHDLIGRTFEHDDEDDHGAHDLASAIAAPDGSGVSLFSSAAPAASQASVPEGRAPAAAPMHVAQAAQLPEPPANPSHVHLVLDDGPERTVVTVALRGSEVRVALRASDDATGAALARNAASLDHAMRARGLQLGELTDEREPQGQRQPRDPEPRERRDPHAERFVLEEKP